MKMYGPKWFHKFPTTEDDRKCLGAVHPKTGEYHVFCALHMGASISLVEIYKGRKFLDNTVAEVCSRGYSGMINYVNLAIFHGQAKG